MKIDKEQEELGREISNGLIAAGDDAKQLGKKLNEASFMPGKSSYESIHALKLKAYDLVAQLENLEEKAVRS